MFSLESGNKFEGLTLTNLMSLIEKLDSKAGIKTSQIVEAASFSQAMVIRVALGLDAKDAHIAVLVNNSLASQIALATLRQLINSGATGLIILADNVDLKDQTLLEQLKYHEHIQTEVFPWSSNNVAVKDITELLENQDTILSGLFNLNDLESLKEEQSKIAYIINVLNEIETPIHSLIAPLGVNPDTGERFSNSLISSSTLSIGVPLAGLSICKDQVGRHYLCDISVSAKIKDELNSNVPTLFNEQPVVQIFS